uniref:Multidrug resistance-associated protein 4 n=2 Tax=Melanaphis sacchari TaxID=742174 RepID=A0A2H8TKH7_9HEMI
MNRFITDNESEIKRSLNPKQNANIFESITYSWMLNLFKTGNNRDLDETDLYMTLEDQISSPLGDKLENEWRLELINAYSTKRKPSLLRVLIKIFGCKYLLSGLVFGFNDIFFR